MGKRIRLNSPHFHNSGLEAKVAKCQTAADFERLREGLKRAGAFDFPCHPTGLYPAVGTGSLREATSGYTNVWVRDNIHVAYALLRDGQTKRARRVACQLARYFRAHSRRFRQGILRPSLFRDPMQRPHIRFDGSTLKELPVEWSHAQNDAMGYFLWFYCLLIDEGVIPTAEVDRGLLSLFVLFFKSIRYWQDEDSGHWEEIRKVAASSIGTVVAALERLERLMVQETLALRKERGLPRVDIQMVRRLKRQGETALNGILPAECLQSHGQKRRRYDAATLFLIYPLQVVDAKSADAIMDSVRGHLQGAIGIKRYLRDSYWAADFRGRVLECERTVDYSCDLTKRDTLHRHVREAQWCIFDPIVSIIYGRRFRQTGRARDRKCQRHYLLRSLAQLTDDRGDYLPLRCPELYFLEGGRFVPNDHTPLLWTQAHLLSALHEMVLTLKAC